MSSAPNKNRCERTDQVAAYTLGALEPDETKSMAAHVPACAECRQEQGALDWLANVLADWRSQVSPPPTSLWNRLVERIAVKERMQDVAARPPGAQFPIDTMAAPDWQEPAWHEVATGITCKLLSSDVEMDRVGMLVRLSPGVSYPPHRHSSVEELYLLEGELWIDGRKLLPGDYSRAEPGTEDQKVWSPTGCMCFLITSPSDQLR